MNKILTICTLAFFVSPLGAAELELARAVRDWEFFNAVGERSAVLGKESGVFEAWVFPLKIFKNFQLQFTLNGRVMPARAVARSVIYRPGSSTIVYSGDYYEEHFLVRQTFVAPPKRNGVLMRLEIDCSANLLIEASFERDFTLMWPAGLGGTFGSWDRELKAFVMGEDQGRFFALVGSPDAALLEREYGTNYSSSPLSRFSLGEFEGPAQRLLIIAASFDSRQDLTTRYRDFLRGAPTLGEEAENAYREYLSETVRLDLPDDRLQRAYDWVSVKFSRNDENFRLEVENSGNEPVRVVFSPALAPSAAIGGAALSGRSGIEWKRLEGMRDWHAEFDFEAPVGRSELTVQCRGDFALSSPAPVPGFGEPSSNLKIVALDWEEDGSSVRVRLSGLRGRSYRLDVRGGKQVRSVVGAQLSEDGKALGVRIPGAGAGYAEHTVVLGMER